jgi:hypothetical protein
MNLTENRIRKESRERIRIFPPTLSIGGREDSYSRYFPGTQNFFGECYRPGRWYAIGRFSIRRTKSKRFCREIVPANEPKPKPMQTTLELKTDLLSAIEKSKRTAERLKERGVLPPRIKSLDEAKAHLNNLRRTAIERGIQPPSSELPKTLGRAQDEIEHLEQQLTPVGTSQSATLRANAESSQVPAAKTTENVAAKARAFLAKPPAQSSGRPVASSSSRALNPRDMTASQLERAIEAEKDVERRALLFHELRGREAGKPTREIAEIAAKATDRELEQLITAEKNLERRTMLFKELCRRTRK